MPGAALSPSATSLTSPLAVQTSSNPWGWTRGEATATPSVTANQANISRVSQNEERSACMSRDYGLAGAGVNRLPPSLTPAFRPRLANQPWFISST